MKRLALMTAITFAASAVAAEERGAPQLEEIIVTAQYRAESLQEVPVAVTAFSAEDIVEAGIETTQDFVNLTPNMTLDDSFTLGNTFVQVRGVAQINNADSPVAIVVDGVPQNNQKQFRQELFDIERIEVLKGPQGSLYGRNAIGGAVNIVTKMPTESLEGGVTVGAGNGGLQKANAFIGGPIVEDKLMFRLTAAYKEFDGVIDNDYLGTEVDFYETKDIRGRLLWNVTDQFSADLRVAYSDADGGCCWDTFLFNPLIGNAPNPTGISNPNNNRYQEPAMNILGRTDVLESTEVTLKLTWSGEVGEFSYIFNDTSMDEDYFADLDFTDGVDDSLGWLFTNVFFGGLPVAADQQQLLSVDLRSHEFRFTSDDTSRVRWIAGAYFLETERSLATIGGFDFAPTTPTFSRDAFSGVAFINLLDDNDNEAWALFGQLEYDITDDLELTFGLRYDNDERHHRGTVIGGGVNTDRKKTFRDLQPRIILTKTWSEDMLGYVSYSRGFRSGGFNGPAVGSQSFAEETLDNYEIGFKSTWLDQRLQLNAAAFYAQSDDFQFFFVDLATASQVIANIEEVEMVGAEVEVQALLSEGWTLYANLGVTDSSIEKSASRPQDEGNRTPKNQKYTLNVGSQYTWPVADGVFARARVDYEHRGRKYWHPDNRNSMDPFGLLSARFALEGERWSATLWGRSITDEEYWQDYNAAAFSGALGDIGFLGRGRTYGLDLSWRFE